MKRLFALLMVLALLLAGCGASSNASAPMAKEEAMEAPAADVLYSGSTMDGGAGAQLIDQKLIKTVSIRAETEDLDAMLTQLNAQIADLGGYIEYQDSYNGSMYSGYRSRSADLTIRIPAQKLDGFITQVEGFSNIISKNQSQEDVTLQYVDTQSRMDALEVEQQRLLELLEKAETMTDLLEIEARLTEVRYELESITSQMRVLENQVNYATVELHISEVEVYTETEPLTAWQRIGTGFTENLKDIGEGLVDFFVWAVTYSPQLILFAAVIVIVVTLLRRAAKKRTPKQPPQPPTTEG